MPMGLQTNMQIVADADRSPELITARPSDPPSVPRRVLMEEAAARVMRPVQREQKIPTIILDQNALFRAGLLHILAQTRFRIVAQGSTLSDLPPKILSRQPCVLLMGLEACSDVLSTLTSLREQYHGLHVMVLGTASNCGEALAAIEAGSSGYLVRSDLKPEVLIKALDLVLLGASVVPCTPPRASMAQRSAQTEPDFAANGATPPSSPQPWRLAQDQPGSPRLSNRERTILSCLMQGASNKLIARELEIAEATVKVHVKSLLRKIQVGNRTQAAMWGTHHLAPPDSG